MPAYTYTCPECKTTCDRIVSYATRDEQICEQPLGERKIGEDAEAVCEAKLIRDEIGLSARMTHQWGQR